MSAREYVLIIDDDPAITEALAMLLDEDGRTTIICSDVESAEIMLARYPVTHVLTDVQFSGWVAAVTGGAAFISGFLAIILPEKKG